MPRMKMLIKTQTLEMQSRRYLEVTWSVSTHVILCRILLRDIHTNFCNLRGGYKCLIGHYIGTNF